MDNVSELLNSTLLKHVLILHHAPMDNMLVDHLSELLHSTPIEPAPAQGNSQSQSTPRTPATTTP
jgi:hypothetical protein